MSIYPLVITVLSRAQRAFDYSDINCLSLNLFPLNPLISIDILYNDLSTFLVLMTRRICLTIRSFINRWSHLLRRNQKPVTLRVEELIMYFFSRVMTWRMPWYSINHLMSVDLPMALLSNARFVPSMRFINLSYFYIFTEACEFILTIYTCFNRSSILRKFQEMSSKFQASDLVRIFLT